jgi:hypothetical protein
LESQRLGGLEVDDQLEFSRALDWQIGRLVAFENPASVDARSTKRIRDVVAVADQAAVVEILAKSIDRRYRMARRQCNDLVASTNKESARTDDKRAGPFLHKVRKCRVDVIRSADIQHNKLQAKTTRDLLFRQSGASRVTADLVTFLWLGRDVGESMISWRGCCRYREHRKDVRERATVLPVMPKLYEAAAASRFHPFTFAPSLLGMSALPPRADMCSATRHVR